MNNKTEQIFIVNTSDTPPAVPKIIEPVVSTEGNADFSTECRTCATVTEFLIPIFDGEGLQNNLVDKINKHLPIQVSESDVLPLAVCYQCVSTLLAWHELVQCCVQTDAALRARLPPGADAAESKSNSTNVIQNSGQKQQIKFKEIINLLEGAAPPPAYASTSTSAPAPAPAPAPPGVPAPAPAPLGAPAPAPPVAPAPAPPGATAPAPAPTGASAPAPPAAPAPAPVPEPPAAPAPAPPVARGCAYCAPPAAPAPAPPAASAPAPPAAPAPLPAPVPLSAPARDCAYCEYRLPAHAYRDHLLAAHSSRLFYCDECSSYVDRRKFVIHMSLHAVEYAAKQAYKPERQQPARKAKNTKNTDRNENDDSGKCSRRTNKNRDRPQSDGRTGPNAGSDRQENEFSDHSDSEDGFGPLPESVFEAIENSLEESQLARAADAHAPDTGAPGRSDGAENAPPPPPPGPRGKTGPEKKSRACPICGKMYTASSSYFYHMKHCHGARREHPCGACGKRFGTRGALAAHEPVHSGARAFGCERCGKRFRSKAGLYIHAQTHGAARRWACGACPRAFRWRAQLARHAARHGAERAHACATCARGFSVRADLLRHARTHARGDHACPACGLRFSQRRYLKVHVDRKHPPAPTGTEPAPLDVD